MLNVLLLIIILILVALLITAYVVTPIITWLVMNPLGGVALLVIIAILASVVFIRETREDKKD